MKSLWRYEVNYDVVNIELFLRICKDMHIVTVFCFVLSLEFFVWDLW